MPISYLPLVIPILLLTSLVFAASKGVRPFLNTLLIGIVIIQIVVLAFWIPGWLLMVSAERGDGAVQYRLAKWHENHCGDVNEVIVVPCEGDVENGYKWLVESAFHDYPPALYTLGVRIKYAQAVFGIHGPKGVEVIDKELGQAYIDRALMLGYEPQVDEELHYWQDFRK